MKIAIVHDSFTQMGGAERVVDVLHEMFPEAPVFTLALDQKFKEKYKNWDIRTSPLQVLYSFLGKLQYLLPWIPWAVDQFDFSEFDLVISSSSGFVKNIRVPKNVKHVCYCHTPPRFLWIDKDYVKQEVPFLLRPFVWLLLKSMKKWDLARSKQVTKFIANSKEVQERINKIYQQPSLVIYPAIDVNFWKPTRKKSDYFLLAGRLQPHKNNELIIKIFSEFYKQGLNKQLHVVGTGRQENYLKSIATPNIIFLGAVDDQSLRDEYSGATAFIYPQVEDFGLMPLEAAACGTPTLAYKRAGSLETVLPGQTGELFENYDEEKIKEIILKWNNQKYKQDVLTAQANNFSKEIFINQLAQFINQFS